MFIGMAAENYQLDQNLFRSNLFASNFIQAREIIHLIDAGEMNLPDVIVFNHPLPIDELEDFGRFIGGFPRLKNIPLIYACGTSTFKNFATLKLGALVDDVINPDNFGVDFHKKVSFLKKVKNHPPAPFLKRLDHLENAAEFMSGGHWVKRILDIVVSASILILSLPFFILIAIAIKIESKGPIFYNVLRAGKNYKVFKFYKFRSMVTDAESLINNFSHLNQYGEGGKRSSFLKIKNDPRVTKVGKFLRKTSLDELPQMFNVLKGDMSLVGNRPLPLREAESLVTNEYVERFMAPAGITGLWQVTKKEKPNMTAQERIDLDIVYAQKFNLISDLKIMIKTPGALLQNIDN
jgi:lipopolysaccharide/colanic/teichoic acid biosynthesis glycosyltransferase